MEGSTVIFLFMFLLITLRFHKIENQINKIKKRLK